MDDVDRIILKTLKSLGWSMETNCNTLKETSLENIAGGLVKCLQAINSNCNLHTTFPQNIAQRYKAAIAIANDIKELEYPGEIGYPTIMYPNETELRKIFLFLIDKLPKEAPLLVEEANDRLSVLHRKAKLKVRSELDRPWIPFHCIKTLHKFGKTDVGPQLISYENENSEYLRILLDRHTLQIATSKLDKIGSQPAELNYEVNSKKIIKIPFSLFEHSSRVSKNSYENIFPTKEDEITNPEESRYLNNKFESLEKKKSELDLELKDILQKIELSKENILKYQSSIKYSTETIDSMEKQLTCLKELPAEANTEEIKSQLLVALESNKGKEKRVKEQWIKHKTPLESELQSITQEIHSKQGNAKKIMGEIMEAQENSKHTLDELNKKEVAIVDIQNQLKKFHKGTNRSEYTDKIFDIASKVERQRRETDKVILDIKRMHKEVNILTGKLSRTFNYVENVIFNKLIVWKDLKEEYRIIIGIHEAYGELNNKLYEILNVNRETASVMQQVETQKKENIEEQLETLQSDLENILKENKILAQKCNNVPDKTTI